MTTNNKISQTEAASSNVKRDGGAWHILGDLASVKLATAIGSVIVLACILGTILPQGQDVQKYLSVNPSSAGLMKFLASLGLTNVFEAWWFIVLLVLFSFNIAACLIRRVTARVRAGGLGIPGWGFLLTHLSMLLILGGAVIRGAVGQKGVLEIQQGSATDHFMTSRGPAKMPFTVGLQKFEIEYYDNKPSDKPVDDPDILSIIWADRNVQTQMSAEVGASVVINPPGLEPTESNSFTVAVSRYVPDFVIDMNTREVGTRSEQPNNPAVLVDINGPDMKVSKWLFANFPDFDMRHSGSGKEGKDKQLTIRYHSTGGARLRNAETGGRRIKSFKSTLQLMENGNVLKEKTIEVNSPLSYKGYTLYQSGYNPEDHTWSTLQVVSDPGVPVVYTGFLSMISGLVLLLCFKRTPVIQASGEKPPGNGGLSS